VVNRNTDFIYQTDAVLHLISHMRAASDHGLGVEDRDETVQSTSMFRKLTLALLAGASCLVAALDRATAFDGLPRPDATAIYTGESEPAAPMRSAYAERSNHGRGLIEMLFGDLAAQDRYQQQGAYPSPTLYQQQPTYEPQSQFLRQEDATQRPFDPRFAKQEVEYRGNEGPGTIVIDTPNKFLFLVEGNGRALRYGIGVGRPGFTWSGIKTISAKREWPEWTPPAQMLARRPDLPRHMEGGPENPLGARAMYLGSSLYRIHGSNEPWTIGTNVSSGCIRMRNEDVIDLYGRVKVGTRVIVL
jgi:lipoprotein-anchoring transpeptidase ErfK/SrfK